MMIEAEKVGYPTRGELMHFLFKATGVMPEKRDLAPDFDEAKRRKLQKALERLSDEDGDFSSSLNEIVQQLSYLVAGYLLPHVPLHLAVGEVLDELLALYSNTLLEEGTFLCKRETVRWLVADRWSHAAPVFAARQITLFGLRGIAEFFPQDQLWCLPSFEDDKPVWPLAKVMRLIYAKAGLNQTQFHYPGRQADESDTICKCDLENAQNWISGGHLPSAAALHSTFLRAFKPLTSGDCKAAEQQQRQVSGALMALFLARITTYVTRDIDRLFGREFLLRICQTFEQTLVLALEDTRHVEENIEATADEQGIPAQDPDLRAQFIDRWNHQLKERLRGASGELQLLLRSGTLSDEAIQKLVNRYGALPVVPQLEWLLAPAQHEIPTGFADMVFEGEKLAKDSNLSLAQEEAYEARSIELGVSAMLPWMVSWLRFIVNYRQEDDKQAWEWISKAYAAARYTAGQGQYRIVNSYIEMAAKMSKKLCFRKGVDWARYTGISVRWLREKELTAENIEFTMEILRRARYHV